MPPIESLEATAEETAQYDAVRNEETVQPSPEPTPQPSPEPAPAPTPAPAAASPAPSPEKPTRLVPHQALHEERTRRQALERRIAELEKPRSDLAADPNGEMPDENTDPLGTIAWLKAQIAKDRGDRQAAQQQAEQVADLGRRVKARVDAYAAEHPEYGEQLNFLRESRFNELRFLGLDDQSAIRQVMGEEMSIGQMAIDKDLDPGEIIANLSKHRGWQAKQPEPVPTPTPTPKPAAQTPEQHLARLAKGQKAAVSPSGSGGGAPEAEMTLERLASLSGAAFDEAWKAHGKRLMN